jgi:hypothetical protein
MPEPISTAMAWLDKHAGAVQAVVGILIFAATVAYVCFTIRLSRFAGTQVSDQRAIQRAYISAEPEGLHPLHGETREGHFHIGHTNFRNGGHIPARRFRWYATIACDDDGLRENFPVPAVSEFEGTTIIAPGGIMRFGTKDVQLPASATGWVYVWGAYTYDDGFVSDRYATFCHRYNRKALRRLDHGYAIPASDARLHRFGNTEPN